MATDHFDDPNIPNEERLFRRIHLIHIVAGDGGRSEVSSAAFRAMELSVNLEGVMQAAGREPQDSLRAHPNDLLMSIAAGVCRRNGQIVGPDPIPEEPAHGYAFGTKSRNIRKALRDAAGWIVPGEAPSWEKIRMRKQQLGLGGSEPGALD
jgi:hypothetical protein